MLATNTTVTPIWLDCDPGVLLTLSHEFTLDFLT